ncbi:MAG: type II toxin-antitoxin system RelE/ParE family toxin [Candidatus Adiutrix sp.]|jgi:toxin ParE1/3/4|nr:type II toxin-antitoxin system RelE/ParE family toxin [Candidatus Adiutrix sp.]
MPGKKLVYGILLSPLAELDLEEIWLYTFRQWSVEQADTYHRSLISAIEGLAAGRKVWQKTNVRPGYWKYRVGRHIIFFHNNGGFLNVIRILHESMDVEQHLDVGMAFDAEE